MYVLRSMCLPLFSLSLLLASCQYLDENSLNEIVNAYSNPNITKPSPTTPEKNKEDQGLLGYWKFDEMSGLTFDDHSGNNYHAVASSERQLPEGISGLAVGQTPGNTIRIPSSLGNFNAPQFTIEAWVYSDTDPYNPGGWENEKKIFCNDALTCGPSCGWDLKIRDFGKIDLVIGNGSYWTECVGSTVLEAKTWYHILGTYDGKKIKVYLNGELENAVPYAGGFADPCIDAQIGSLNGEYSFSGRIDEVRLLDYAMSSEEVFKRYMSCKKESMVSEK